MLEQGSHLGLDAAHVHDVLRVLSNVLLGQLQLCGQPKDKVSLRFQMAAVEEGGIGGT